MFELRTARAEEFPELLKMLNVVFFTEDDPAEKRDFLRLLPKLYKDQYKPWDNNYCAFENGKPVAAVGMYVDAMEIAGQPLALGGIGNVAVDPSTRGKGYMKLTMDMAMDAMKARGCAIAALGGDRHRYRYWGFDNGGVCGEANFSAVNLRHHFGNNELAAGWSAKPVEPGDTQALAQIQAFLEASPIHLKHNAAAMHDILCSWREQPHAIWYNDQLAGFFTLNFNGKHASQLQVCDWADSLEMPLRAVLSVLPEKSHVHMEIPLWRRDVLAMAEHLTENFELSHTGQYCVLNWEATLRALLALQAQCKTLLDGQLTVRIQGYAGEETLKIAVQNGQPSVEPVGANCVRPAAASAISGEHSSPLLLNHLEAHSYFLGLVCAARQCPVAQNWFPLPMKLFSVDTV